MEVDVKTWSDASVNKSEELTDANSTMAHEVWESDSRMEAEIGSGLGKDESSDKEIPMLDPSTGLFVTDSDSQNSVYVANPENISFEDCFGRQETKLLSVDGERDLVCPVTSKRDGGFFSLSFLLSVVSSFSG